MSLPSYHQAENTAKVKSNLDPLWNHRNAKSLRNNSHLLEVQEMVQKCSTLQN
jgi:hypothetical protein